MNAFLVELQRGIRLARLQCDRTELEAGEGQVGLRTGISGIRRGKFPEHSFRLLVELPRRRNGVVLRAGQPQEDVAGLGQGGGHVAIDLPACEKRATSLRPSIAILSRLRRISSVPGTSQPLAECRKSRS